MATASRPPRIEAPQSAALEALRRVPIDDEPTTDDDRAALAEGREAVRRGDVVTTAELRRQLGL
jgi:hypothetical protein